MADKRMFSRAIVESDAFLDLPIGAQGLYLHLCMSADDEGFVGAPRRAARVCGASEDDLAALISARFLISFDSGLVVIKHWCVNNALRKDRVKATTYTEERRLLGVKDNGAYTLADKCLTVGGHLSDSWRTNDGQVTDKCPHRLDKISIDKNSIDYVIQDKKREERDLPILKEQQQKNLAEMRAQIRKANELI